MKKMRLTFVIVLLILVSNSLSSNPNEEGHFKFLSSISLPDKLEYCGELVPLEDNEVKQRAEREFFILLQQPSQIILYLKRSTYYFPLYDRILRDLGLPLDLKYLSVAESALYMSKSSVGAVGLWQFMPITAKEYGLRVDDYVDERRHIEKSTIAACRYLKASFDLFNSWTLAAASYNMGISALINNLEFQDEDNYYNLYLNEETSRFLLKIAIIKEFIENPERYGFNVKEDECYYLPEIEIIEINDKIKNLSNFAKEHGTNYKMLKYLNPWILKRELDKPKNEPYKIYIPVQN